MHDLKHSEHAQRQQQHYEKQEDHDMRHRQHDARHKQMEDIPTQMQAVRQVRAALTLFLLAEKGSAGSGQTLSVTHLQEVLAMDSKIAAAVGDAAQASANTGRMDDFDEFRRSQSAKLELLEARVAELQVGNAAAGKMGRTPSSTAQVSVMSPAEPRAMSAVQPEPQSFGSAKPVAAPQQVEPDPSRKSRLFVSVCHDPDALCASHALIRRACCWYALACPAHYPISHPHACSAQTSWTHCHQR